MLVLPSECRHTNTKAIKGLSVGCSDLARGTDKQTHLLKGAQLLSRIM